MEQSYTSLKEQEISLEQPEEQQIHMHQSSIEPAEEQHSLELHIDVRSIRNLAFPSNIVISYTLSLIDTFEFTSKAPVPVSKGPEVLLRNTFAHYKFRTTQDSLCEQLSYKSLDINVYNSQGGMSALVGTAHVPLAELLGPKAAVQKTSQSVVRVFDVQVPILDKENEMGKLRVILYLEDHGPVSMATAPETKPRTVTTFKQPQKETEETQAAIEQINLWKKAEEAKFKAALKEREQEVLSQITEEWKNKEEKREAEFHEILESLRGAEGKLRTKSKELLRREQQIMRLEEELKGKIVEITKQLADKETEIISVKTKCKDEKATLDKDKKALLGQIETSKKQIKEMEEKYKELKKEYEESPINQLKQEINAKQIQVIEIERRLEKSIQAKEQYRAHYEKIKAELIKLRNSLEMEKERNIEKQREEIEKLRLQIASQKFAEEEQKEMHSLKTQLENLQKEYAEPTPRKEEGYQPTKLLERTYKAPEVQKVLPRSELERLIAERKELLESGLYNENDEVIRVLSTQIEQVQRGYREI